MIEASPFMVSSIHLSYKIKKGGKEKETERRETEGKETEEMQRKVRK